MSKISLEPNDSGAGTFSIVSPDSNTNRTLTLPDASGTLARTESLVGQVCFFAMDTAPDGFLKANGAAVSRTTFSALFNAIGTTFGAGDGSTTFNLPDMRGEFPRGWNDGRGVDSGRSFGSAQLDGLGEHIHSILRSNRGFDRWDVTNNDSAITELDNTITFKTSSYFNNFRSQAPNRTLRQNGNTSTNDNATNETRPRNLALLACIKF